MSVSPPGQLLVESRAPLTACLQRSDGAHAIALQDGEVLIRVVSFVFTANTITYAIAGKSPLQYFKHFPVPVSVPDAEKYARPVCWGTGVVVTSRCGNVPVGSRLHGLFAFAPFVTLQPTRVKAGSFVDGASHRRGLLEPYLTYSFSGHGPYKGLTPDEEAFQLADGGLFSTGWSMSQQVDVDPAKPGTLLVTSASSRTAYSAAFTAKFHNQPVRVVGLTSSKNVGFVRSLGVYDVVCAYSDVLSVKRDDARPGVAVFDLAGDRSILQDVYRHFQGDITSCGMVGGTHARNSTGHAGKLDLYGSAAPQGFIVFAATKAIANARGRDKSAPMLVAAAAAFKAERMPRTQIKRVHGSVAVLEVFEKMVRDEIAPGSLMICSLWPEEDSTAAALPARL